MFYMDVAKVDLDVAYTCMLQAYVLSVSGVSYVCYKCFIWMLHMFAIATHVFLSFFWCLQVIQLFRMYVANISSRCCKSRSGVAHVAMGPTSRSRLLQLLRRRRAGADGPSCMHVGSRAGTSGLHVLSGPRTAPRACTWEMERARAVPTCGWAMYGQRGPCMGAVTVPSRR